MGLFRDPHHPHGVALRPRRFAGGLGTCMVWSVIWVTRYPYRYVHHTLAAEGEDRHGGASSRVLLRPADFERSFRFYAQTLGLHIYREWGSGPTRGVVFFLGGGFLELSGSSNTTSSEKVSLWLQVRDVDAVGRKLKDSGAEIIEAPVDKPWGLREMRIQDPDGVRLIIVDVPKDHPLRRP